MVQALVRYSLRAREGEARIRLQLHGQAPLDQHIRLVSVAPVGTPARKWFWICPRSGKRCTRLFLPLGGDRFLSGGRGGWNLSTVDEATLSRGSQLARAYWRLGHDYIANGARDDVPKPLGMSWRTYYIYMERVRLLMAESTGPAGFLD